MPPLGREAAPKHSTDFRQMYRVTGFYACFAAERGQAPSPQRSVAVATVQDTVASGRFCRSDAE
ncbi:hypothetical protein C1884_14575 [Pseudomonas sp. GW460-R15]|nr:hypothetical protein C1887_16875 [Pseudomonas sp. GW456-R21]POA66749.1 hypothetical protein C1884_14575 [Pseudomonas sp. GW460-R15]